MASQKTSHNHVWIFTEGYQDGCPRCAELKTIKLAGGETPHNHVKQPFGRRVAECPRCIELANGAKPRESLLLDRAAADAQRCREIRAHFANPNNTCDHITCYDY